LTLIVYNLLLHISIDKLFLRKKRKWLQRIIVQKQKALYTDCCIQYKVTLGSVNQRV
jgi:hypothetical protein